MQRLRTMHLFAGAGGGLLADLLLGHQPVCAVEIDEYCQQVLSARQKDNCLPWFPIFADVTQFDGKPWRGRVDVVSGGFPCQDISAAGTGAGLDGERSGLWVEMARIIGEVRPRYAFVENSPALTSRGLHRVLGDLAEMGFDARWGVLSAADVGFPHLRERIWIVAHARCELRKTRMVCECGEGACGWGDEAEKRRNNWQLSALGASTVAGLRSRISPEPGVGRMAHGVARRPDRLVAIGNGQVPLVAATAWRILTHNGCHNQQHEHHEGCLS